MRCCLSSTCEYTIVVNIMSARVFKPILLSEMPKMRSSPTVDVKLASKSITKVRRALFNSSDPEENSSFLDAELTKIAIAQSERWNFDFLSGRPMVDTTSGNPHYLWIPVCPGVSSVLLPQHSVIHVIESSPDISDLYAPIVSTSSTGGANEETIMSTDDLSTPSKTPRKQFQSKITDFLSVRKRTEISASTTKKLTGSTPRPRKIPRLTS